MRSALVKGIGQDVPANHEGVTMAAGRPTQVDVARLAGVSTATVSYVASGRSNRAAAASPEVTERVKAAMATLGYRPLWAGRALRRRRAGVLAVVTYSPLNPWAEVLLDQVQRIAAAEHLYVAILRYTTTDSIFRILDLLRKGWADGALVIGYEDLDPATQDGLASLAMPLLVMSNTGPASMSYIRQNEVEAMREGLRHLKGSGVERLIFVEDREADDGRAVARLRWLNQAKEGLWDGEIPRRRISGPRPDPARLREVIQEALAGAGEGPVGMLCGSDRAAIALLWATVTSGVDVPGELRLIGMGNIDEGRISAPPLTTLGIVSPDYSEALEHLVARMDDPDVEPAAFDREWQLIVRGTA